MARARIFLVVMVATGSLAALALAPAKVGASKRAPASVKMTKCLRGPDVADRSAEFRGAMKRVKDTRRMWMRFNLQERAADGKYRIVDADGLGLWRKSKRGVRRFAHRQKVLGLERGTDYKSVVQFRWYPAKGGPIRRATRRSGLCRQPGPLPNLHIARIVAKSLPKQPGTTRYIVRVINDGRLVSPRSSLRLSVDGAVADTVPVLAMAPDRGRRVVVDGPACKGSVRVELDPDVLVRERSKKDNARSYGCPAT